MGDGERGAWGRGLWGMGGIRSAEKLLRRASRRDGGGCTSSIPGSLCGACACACWGTAGLDGDVCDASEAAGCTGGSTVTGDVDCLGSGSCCCCWDDGCDCCCLIWGMGSTLGWAGTVVFTVTLLLPLLPLLTEGFRWGWTSVPSGDGDRGMGFAGTGPAPLSTLCSTARGEVPTDAPREGLPCANGGGGGGKYGSDS